MSKKKEKEISERMEFLNVYYTGFNGWLSSVGFRSANYKESATHLDYYYSHYNKLVNPLSGIERYLNDALKISVRFIRDRFDHKFLFVGELGTHSKTYSIEETKGLILDFVKKERDKKQEELNKLVNI